MELALWIAVTVVSIVGAVVVLAAFVWGARKDGEYDESVQKRLGIRRKTRLGR